MPTTPLRPSTAAVTVLCLLRAAPLHPYGMQRLIKVWGKEDVVNIGQRANLYKTIKRLRDAGLIAVRQTERSKQYPERTVYELTADGLEEPFEEIVRAAGGAALEIDQWPVHGDLGQSGERAERDLLDTGLSGGSQRHRIAVTTQTRVDP